MPNTIAAISTPRGSGGIGIVRISGGKARIIADAVFKSRSGKKLSDAKGYTAYYGRVHDACTDIDEAIALVFAKPHSYTGEDVVEISFHGGLYVAGRVLRAVLDAGALSAEAGEFTKRAYLNGKLNLNEAEAVMDIINSASEMSMKTALADKDGRLSKEIDKIKVELISAASHMSAWVDYPDEDIEEIEFSKLSRDFKVIEEKLGKMLSGYEAGRAVREGVETVIVGRPNVGKSTLMNLLSGYEKSIVTMIPGTTRDIIEETVIIGSIILKLADTAGIRESDDLIERIGVKKASDRLEKAELILAVFDFSEPLSQEDHMLIDRVRDKKVIAVINKTDLEKRLDTDYIDSVFSCSVNISAETGKGYEMLSAVISKMIGIHGLDMNEAVPSTERQRNSLQHARDSVSEAINAIEYGMTMDAVNVCVDEAISALLALTGERVSEKVVEQVFERFCVGK